MRRIALAAFLLFSGAVAHATDISVVGLFPGKAVLIVDGAPPRTYSVGNSIAPGTRMIAANESGATFSINGKKQVLSIGQHMGSGNAASGATTTLHADSRGHFFANAQINGGSVRMMVDTGATRIALTAADAQRLRINYMKGEPGYVNTANGSAQAYSVQLDTIRVGDLVLHQVDAMVLEGGLTTSLLGLSFLNRTEMRRDGDTMVLKKRF